MEITKKLLSTNRTLNLTHNELWKKFKQNQFCRFLGKNSSLKNTKVSQMKDKFSIPRKNSLNSTTFTLNTTKHTSLLKIALNIYARGPSQWAKLRLRIDHVWSTRLFADRMWSWPHSRPCKRVQVFISLDQCGTYRKSVIFYISEISYFSVFSMCERFHSTCVKGG